MSMTNSGMMGFADPVQKANITPFKFEMKYKDDPASPGKLKAEEWVEWHINLSGGQTIPRTCRDAVHRLRRGAERASDPNDEVAMIWRTIEPHYKSWKAGGGDEVIDGTPLVVWPGVTADVVDMLRPFRIRSVEDLSMIGDGVMQKIPHPNIAKYRDMAKKFLATKEMAVAVRELSNRDDELTQLKAEMERMRKLIADSDLAQRNAPEPDNPLAPRRRRMVAAEA